jgi:hypothetical protein
MNYSYKSFKLCVWIIFGVFCLFNSGTLTAQTFYSTARCIDILKEETLVLEHEMQSSPHTVNLNTSKAKLAYYKTLINYWDNLINNNATQNGAEISFAVNHFLNVLYNENVDSVDNATPLTKSEAEVIRNNTIDKLSH